MKREAFATMDVYLKKRWDLVPNLVDTVKAYANYEENLMEEIVKLRNTSYDQMSFLDKIDVNSRLSNELSKIMVSVEKYPDLKASQNFLELSKQLEKVEEDIANSRKYFNAVVKKYNIKVEMFPSNIIAGMFGYKVERMFEANMGERDNVKAEL